MTADSATGNAWVVIMPVKGLAAAKTRMEPASGSLAALAFAFFQDTLAALLASTVVARVIVATADARVASWAESLGCTVVSDADHPGINPAARWAAQHSPARTPIAIVVSDLPSLSPTAVDAVLTLASARDCSFLADAAGTGTTMWMAMPGAAIDPRFGLDSCAAHVAAGAVDLAQAGDPLPDVIASARRDVDTDVDLTDARRIGVGQHTRAILEAAAPGRSDAGLLVVTAIGRETSGDLDTVDESGRRHRISWPIVIRAGLLDVHAGQRLVIGIDAPGSIGSISLP